MPPLKNLNSLSSLLPSLFIILCLPFLLSAGPSKSNIYTANIRDSLGRIVIYHGVCVSNYSKHSNRGMAGITWHEKKDFDRLGDWGFNLVRYMMFWEALEPDSGAYDYGYLKASLEKIRSISADVVIDLHQDLYCRKFGGNGFPEWSARDKGKKFRYRHPWSLTYLEPAVRNSYAGFWNDPALLSRYCAMLALVMSATDTLTNVIGIDVMNEPFNGFSPGFERKTLSAFYNSILKTADETVYKKMIFFEPQMYASGGLSTSLAIKPDKSWVYAPHYYDPFCHEGRPYKNFNRGFLRKVLSGKVKEAAKFGTPMVLGEFGASPKVHDYLSYITDVADLADEYAFGWCYYSYDRISDEAFGIVDDSLAEQPNLSRLVRVYPQRIAGNNPVFHCEAGRFTLEFDASGIPAPTEIFIPRRCANVVIAVDGIKVVTKQTGEKYTFTSEKGRKKVEITWQ